MKSEIDEIDQVLLMAELENTECQLKHNDDETHRACDFITCPMGYADIGITDFITIPICKECIEALMGDEWVLLYCVHCNSSQWVYKPLSKREYTEKIVWMTKCPKCEGKILNEQ
jgi:hypothetical protein